MVLVFLADLARVGHAVGVDLVLARLARRDRWRGNVVGRHVALLSGARCVSQPRGSRAGAKARGRRASRMSPKSHAERTLPTIHLPVDKVLRFARYCCGCVLPGTMRSVPGAEWLAAVVPLLTGRRPSRCAAERMPMHVELRLVAVELGSYGGGRFVGYPGLGERRSSSSPAEDHTCVRLGTVTVNSEFCPLTAVPGIPGSRHRRHDGRRRGHRTCLHVHPR